MNTGCHIMVLEEALASPDIGNIIQSFLYADELIFAFNLSWELREHFLGDICDICWGLRSWQSWQDEFDFDHIWQHKRDIDDIRRQHRREAYPSESSGSEVYPAGSSDSESSSSWG